MPPVDLIDDVQVSRQQILEEVHGPALQGFRQDGVVGVGTRMNNDVPGLDTETQRGQISDTVTYAHASETQAKTEIIMCSLWGV